MLEPTLDSVTSEVVIEHEDRTDHSGMFDIFINPSGAKGLWYSLTTEAYKQNVYGFGLGYRLATIFAKQLRPLCNQ